MWKTRNLIKKSWVWRTPMGSWKVLTNKLSNKPFSISPWNIWGSDNTKWWIAQKVLPTTVLALYYFPNRKAFRSLTSLNKTFVWVPIYNPLLTTTIKIKRNNHKVKNQPQKVQTLRSHHPPTLNQIKIQLAKRINEQFYTFKLKNRLYPSIKKFMVSI